jgi:hypothetical protein
MGYIKISDPNIIDLNAVHNIINVVNQHSDTLNTLTNNFGAANTTTAANTTWSAADLSHLYDAGNQMIIYGRASFDSSATATSTTVPTNGHVYHKTVTFSTSTNGVPAFTTSTPMVFATANTGNTTAGGISTTFPDAIVHIYNITASTFDIRLFLSSGQNITGAQKVYVNWMALGPKSK